MNRSGTRVLGTAFGRIAGFALLAVVCFAGSAALATAATYNPDLVISNDNMRNRDAMSQADVQAFLDVQTGPLKSLVTSDHAGVKRKASVIIWQACQAWSISPKVMLTMLQKEQTLITRTSLAKSTLARAIGAGCPDAHTNRYPGFGNQMWNGARLLDGYGEGRPGSTIPAFYPGITKSTYTTPVHPQNIATYKLFVYNPSIGAKAPYGDLSGQQCTGNANFWLIYRAFFGSTFADPRMRPVYRFRNDKTGDYIYTTSPAERYHLRAAHGRTWKLEGTAFSIDSSATTGTVPLYRFYNKKNGRHSFVTSTATFKARTSPTGRKTWGYTGVAFRVALKPSPGSVTVWRIDDRKSGASFFTTSRTTVKRALTVSSVKKHWRYRGIAWYLPRAAAE